jgi:hypothetical protein
MTEPNEPDERLLGRASEVLAGVQNGQIVGMICVCFMQTNAINVQVAGDQSLIVRLGSLVVAGDALKVLETQMQQQALQQQPANWGPGGNA